MAAVEADAKERAERRKAATAEATKLKLVGNDHFKSGNYQQAIDFYTQVRTQYFFQTFSMMENNSIMIYLRLLHRI